MDIPNPISFINRFGTNQRSVVQVMSRQSMPKNHVFIQNHKVPFSKQATFNSFQNQSKHANFNPFLWNHSKSTKINNKPSSTHTLTLYQNFQNHRPTILTLLNQMAKGQKQYHVIHPSSSQFPIIPFPINHHYTISSSYSPSTWYLPPIQPQSFIKHISQHAFSHISQNQGINIHNHIYDHIIYLNQSTTSSIQCLS